MNKYGLVSWRLPGNLFNALVICKNTKTNLLQIDFGGYNRGPELDSYDLELLKNISAEYDIKITALALNLFNDIGITLSNKKCQSIFIRAFQCAEKLGISTIFIPSFRKNSINDTVSLVNTASFLRWCCEQTGSVITIGSESILPTGEVKILYDLVNKNNLKFIFDPINLYVSSITPYDYFLELINFIHPDIHIKSPNNSPLSSLSPNLVSELKYISKIMLGKFNCFSENNYIADKEFNSNIVNDLRWINHNILLEGLH